MKSRWFLLLLVSLSTRSPAQTRPAHSSEPLADQLVKIRNRISELEQGLIDDSKAQKDVKAQVSKIQKVLKLQKIEKELSQKRLVELEHTVPYRIK